MEPKTQVEIQLGHMCNNRCVFCVSGQETEVGRAKPLSAAPVIAQLDQAFEKGHRKVTLLGGEPTIQPSFMAVVEHAIQLGFEEIVLFTNGVKTARRSFIEAVVATGGNFTWRISIQGATKESHERTTRKPGSFDRIVRSMGHLKELGQRLTVNMCVVNSNYESVRHFPELLAKYGAVQLHLDMVRPMDAGERTEEEFRQMIPRYSDIAPALREMAAGFPPDFDLNIGNLPYCIAPELASRMHHDGETTDTVAIEGSNKLGRPFDKYFIKRQDKHKPESCRHCVFDDRCNGIFDKYRDFYGYEEFKPVTAERLLQLDPERRLFALHLAPLVERLEAAAVPAPFSAVSTFVAGDRELRVNLLGEEPLTLALGPAGGGAASLNVLSVSVVRLPRERARARLGLKLLWDVLLAAARDVYPQARVWHPLAVDALRGEVRPLLLSRLIRLRQAAPFGALEWTDLHIVNGGYRAELRLHSPGAPVGFWIEEQAGKVKAGYDVGEAPDQHVVQGLQAIVSALTPPRSRAESTAFAGAAASGLDQPAEARDPNLS